MQQVFEIGQMLDLIVRDIDDSQVEVSIQARNLHESVVRNVDLFKIRKAFKTGQSRQAVGLDGEDFEIQEVRNVLIPSA